MLLKMQPRIWNWLLELVTSVSHMMTPAAVMEEKPRRPLSPTPEVLQRFQNRVQNCRLNKRNQDCVILIDALCLKLSRDDGLAVEHRV